MFTLSTADSAVYSCYVGCILGYKSKASIYCLSVCPSSAAEILKPTHLGGAPQYILSLMSEYWCACL